MSVVLVALAVLASRPLWQTEPAWFVLYAVSADNSFPPGGERLLPLDPVTLDDRLLGSGLVRPLGSADASSGVTEVLRWQTPLASADGAVWVAIVDQQGQGPPGENLTIIVRDGSFGPERIRYRAPATPGRLLLSRDGTRLVVVPSQDRRGFFGPPRWETWWVIDTASGTVLANPSAPPPVGLVRDAWVDPTGYLLYRLEAVGVNPATALPDEPTGPRPLRLVALHLFTGQEVGCLELPEVQLGFSTTTTKGRPVSLWPGVARSDDGWRLALVHGDAPRVTLVDLLRLTVERTVTFSRSPDLPKPEHAERTLTSPSPLGGWLWARFGPDGQALYVWGWQFHDATDPGSHLGVSRIDLARGLLDAECATGAPTEVIVAPDGRSIYALDGEGFAEGQSWLMVQHPRLRRLDATTLTVQADRAWHHHWYLIGSHDPAHRRQPLRRRLRRSKRCERRR